MTNEETIAYFKEHNKSLVTVAKNENMYDYDKQVIEADCTRRCFEANEKAIQALEQQPSEGVEVIRMGKNTVKARQGRFVVYDVEWLKEHFNTTEKMLYGLPSEDCTSKELVIEWLKDKDIIKTKNQEENVRRELAELPSVTPSYNGVKTELEQTRWIPVSERLPEKQDCYLVTIKWKGSYSGDVYIETNIAVFREKPKEWDCKGVVAWMPLPEPYKVESEDKE